MQIIFLNSLILFLDETSPYKSICILNGRRFFKMPNILLSKDNKLKLIRKKYLISLQYINS